MCCKGDFRNLSQRVFASIEKEEACAPSMCARLAKMLFACYAFVVTTWSLLWLLRAATPAVRLCLEDRKKKETKH